MGYVWSNNRSNNLNKLFRSKFRETEEGELTKSKSTVLHFCQYITWIISLQTQQNFNSARTYMHTHLHYYFGSMRITLLHNHHCGCQCICGLYSNTVISTFSVHMWTIFLHNHSTAIIHGWPERCWVTDR
jgi:hypothetical protein